jgi:putative Ig domain-containing protein
VRNLLIQGLLRRTGRFAAPQSDFHRRRKVPGTLAAIGFSAVCALTGCGGASSSLVDSVLLTVTTTSLPTGQVETSYSATLAATGGKTPYTWSLANGTLPAGLALNASSGQIIGTPTATANATALTFTVADSSSPAQTKSVNLSLTVVGAGPAPLKITTTSLPNGQVGTSYSTALAASGGTTPYTWVLTSGTLPASLTLNASSGAITGTPAAAASSVALTFTVTDSSSPAQSSSVYLSLTIAAAGTSPLSITTTSLPNGQVGTSYSTTLAASGGTTPYTWVLTNGALPAGLALNASTGTISGIPTATASATALTLTVTDSSSPAQTKSVNLSLTISSASVPTLAITTSSLPNGQVGSGYSATLAATGGTAPYTWSLTSGSLPAGLTLNASTGAITGTPTVTANATPLTFTATDSSSPAQTASANLTLTISPSATGALTITTTALPNGQVGTAYTATLTATGGTTPYTWALTGGTLPAGLTLSATTGAIAGTPTATANNTPLSFSVTDSSSPAQSKSVSLTLYISSSGANTLAITSSALPNGQDGNAYSATLAATGGTAPYTWSVASGTLPAGLTLNATTGAITGTPTATASATTLTFSVSDSSLPVQTKSLNLALTIYSSNGISVSVSPQNVGMTITQTLSLTPTTTDTAGVTWSVTGTGCSGTACGSFSSTTSLTGVAVTYTAPSTAGVYTITASSVTNNSIAANTTIGVTDLAGMTTYHNDLSRDGANTQEYALTPSNVTTSTFGKLFSCTVDEAIYTQPLWIPNLTVNGAVHNVVFVATQNDSLYAFDADNNTTPCTPLWQVSLIDSAHGGTSGEASIPTGLTGSGYLIGQGNGDITPEVGVTGTPVIDPATNTLYVVSKSYAASGPTFFQRLHAIDLASGNEKFSGPVDIAATYPGNGDGGSTTTFVTQQENQRCGLALVNGIVYVAWASHEDTTPFYGWVIGYSASNLSQTYVFNDVPNAPSSPMEGLAGEGGIWMSGGAPAADSSGNLYLITGNGSFDNTTEDYGDSLLQLSPNPNVPSLAVSQYFTPTDQLTDTQNDVDFGSGAVVLIDLPANGGNPTHLAVGGGKDANLYALNRDALGGYGDSNAWQELSLATRGFNGVFSTAAFWNSTLYIATFAGPLQAFSLNPSTAQLTQLPNVSPETFARFGPTASVSSAPDYSNGIVWVIDPAQYCTIGSSACGPAVLHAYDATNLSNELWNSSQGSGNTAGNGVKFTVPTIANGKVYIGTRGNNTGGADNSTTVPGELDVYGLLPN